MKDKKKIVIEFVLVVLTLAVIIGGASQLYPILSGRLSALSAERMAEPAQTEMYAAVTVAPTVGQQAQATAAPQQTQEAAGPVQRFMAPDFTVYADDGTALSLSDMRGKPVVVNFFASWCGPCKYEMPYFEEFYLEYGEEVVFMMVNLCAFGNDTKDAAKAMVAEGGYTFPVYFDTDGDAMMTYGVSSMPTTVFVSAEGELKGRQIGMIDRGTLEATIQAMIAENQGQ